MENSDDLCSMEGDVDGRGNSNNASRSPSTSTAPAASSPYKLFRRQSSFHQMMGGGKVCSDILLVLTVLLFLRANYAAYKNKQLQTLPQLVLSEEMVNNAAASFRVKINYMLLMAHDITLGKDFKLVFKVVIVLWLLSTIGSMVSIFTLTYIGAIMFITVPALYSRFEAHVDRCAGKLHQQFTRHYRIVDESISRLPRNVAKDKDH
nr:reticulon-like protein B16 [Ipomoea trifida]